MTRLALLLLGLIVALALPTTASAYSECGDPPGPAKNVTTVGVSCGDGRAFARKFAKRGITRSGNVRLPSWKSYNARVRRVYGGYDVRATRGSRVIRFQILQGGGSRDCDTNYEGACLDPDSSDYDCEGGSGNGPDYTGEVYVVGDDHFGLDRDGNGVACES